MRRSQRLAPGSGGGRRGGGAVVGKPSRANPRKAQGPGLSRAFPNKATASLQSPSPLPAVPSGTVLQAPEGEQMNYRVSWRNNQAELRPRPCKTALRIAARSSGQTTCDTYIRFPVVGCFPTRTRSNRQNATVTTISHFAQCLFPRRPTGSDASVSSWCHFSTGTGSVVDSGTTVTNCWRLSDMTTTGRFLTISGGRKPVLKSQIKTWPGLGWKFIGCMMERIYMTGRGVTTLQRRCGMRVSTFPREPAPRIAPGCVSGGLVDTSVLGDKQPTRGRLRGLCGA